MKKNIYLLPVLTMLIMSGCASKTSVDNIEERLAKLETDLNYQVEELGAKKQETERTFVQDFLRGYISIDWSGNMVVIKTYSGHSDSVALAVDNLALDEVLGTIAGRDNTVFVCLREGVTGEDFMSQMKEKMPELED